MDVRLWLIELVRVPDENQDFSGISWRASFTISGSFKCDVFGFPKSLSSLQFLSWLGVRSPHLYPLSPAADYSEPGRFPCKKQTSIKFRGFTQCLWTACLVYTVACKGHSISWSVSLLRVYKLEILSLQTRNSKFQVYKHEISSFKRSLGYQVRC